MLFICEDKPPEGVPPTVPYPLYGLANPDLTLIRPLYESELLPISLCSFHGSKDLLQSCIKWEQGRCSIQRSFLGVKRDYYSRVIFNAVWCMSSLDEIEGIHLHHGLATMG